MSCPAPLFFAACGVDPGIGLGDPGVGLSDPLVCLRLGGGLAAVGVAQRLGFLAAGAGLGLDGLVFRLAHLLLGVGVCFHIRKRVLEKGSDFAHGKDLLGWISRSSADRSAR